MWDEAADEDDEAVPMAAPGAGRVVAGLGHEIWTPDKAVQDAYASWAGQSVKGMTGVQGMPQILRGQQTNRMSSYTSAASINRGE